MRENETTQETNERVWKHTQEVYRQIKNDPSNEAQKLWAKLKQEYPKLDSLL